MAAFCRFAFSFLKAPSKSRAKVEIEKKLIKVKFILICMMIYFQYVCE